MSRITRREAIQGLGAAGAAMLLRIDTDAQGQPLTIAGQPVELRIASISPITVRVSLLPKGAPDADLNRDGGLVPLTEQRRTIAGATPVKMGTLSITVSQSPLTVRVADAAGKTVQELTVDETGALEFLIGDAPLLGVRRRRAAIRSPRRRRRDAQRAGRLPAADPRRPRAGAVADRHRGMGPLHPSAVRRLRPARARRAR